MEVIYSNNYGNSFCTPVVSNIVLFEAPGMGCLVPPQSLVAVVNGTHQRSINMDNNAYNRHTEYMRVGDSEMGRIYDLNEGRDLQVLDDIALLEENWNDNGAPSFDEKMINQMRKIINKLTIQPEVFPTANGSIQFEYENEKGGYLEFELFNDNRLKVFSEDSDRSNTTCYMSLDVPEIEKVVRQFYAN